jgi:GNAT superfamily N-acetyltransferase
MAPQDDEFSPMNLQAAARALGDEPDLEWTFFLLLLRSFALTPEKGGRLTGIDLHYEPLSSWEDTLEAFRVNAALLALEQVDPELLARITVGLELFEGAYRAEGGRLRLPMREEPFRGRHSVVVVGLTDDHPDAINPELVFRNTWGERWGDSGLGYIGREYFEAHVDSVWLARPSWIGPSPRMEEATKQRSWQRGGGGAIEAMDLLQSWLTINNVLVSDVVVRGREYRLQRRVSFSARMNNPRFEVIDIRRPEGQICGRCHLTVAGNVTRVEELFVDPAMRRQGLGSELLQRTLTRARIFRSTAVELLLHEADAGRGLARAIAFGTSHGAEWDHRGSRRPNVVSVGRVKVI